MSIKINLWHFHKILIKIQKIKNNEIYGIQSNQNEKKIIIKFEK